MWYTAYIVSSLTWLALLFVEWQIPGFVSSVFPVYLPLIVILACGIATIAEDKSANAPLSRRALLVATVMGGVLAVIVIRDFEVFGAYRVVLAGAVCLTPATLIHSVNINQKYD